MTHHASWFSGSHSRRLGGNNNSCSRSHARKFCGIPESSSPTRTDPTLCATATVPKQQPAPQPLRRCYHAEGALSADRPLLAGEPRQHLAWVGWTYTFVFGPSRTAHSRLLVDVC